MINTVTLNPALDYFVELPELQMGRTNRVSSEAIHPGGKGINVAIVAHHLELESRATGFLAGFTGEEIARRVTGIGVEDHFVRADGDSRINIKLKENDINGRVRETEINAHGAEVTRAHMSKLFEAIERFPDNEFLVLSGNVPSTMDSDIYVRIMQHFAHKNFRYVLDSTGEAFRLALPLGPFLIKPNLDELSDFFGRKLTSIPAILEHCEKLQALGAKNVLLSMGEQGALLVDEAKNNYHIKAPKGTLVASSGSGDSMVAGFLAGYLQHRDHQRALELAVAAGSATAFSEGLANQEMIFSILKRMKWRYQ